MNIIKHAKWATELKIHNRHNKESDIGFVLDWSFHRSNSWVSAFAPHYVEAFVAEFNPIIITDQSGYDKYKRQLKLLVSMEPGWSAPWLTLDKSLKTTTCVGYSDPHLNTGRRWEYFSENNFRFVLSKYYHPFFYHLPQFPKDKFIHFPWAVKDEHINQNDPEQRSDEVVIFGGRAGDAYDIRNWCREQPGITNLPNSGVENKILSDADYLIWLRQFDAIIAAGSSDPKYDLVTPKYFEIAAAGALLIGQYCKDLELLGFTDTNAVIFKRENFLEKVEQYRTDPQQYLHIRKEGRNLIKNRHKISDRIKTIRDLYNQLN